MKNTLFILSLIVLTSCVTNKLTEIPNNSTFSSLDEDRIEILGNVEANSAGVRVWVTFIPIGWCRTSWVETRALKKAMNKYPNADGLIDQKRHYHKTTVPLIVLTPQVKRSKVTGVAYHIRTDEEMEELKKRDYL
jgi:hypothetical protein